MTPRACTTPEEPKRPGPGPKEDLFLTGTIMMFALLRKYVRQNKCELKKAPSLGEWT